MSRPVLFLDFDDVLCLNQEFGGYDVIHALGKVAKGVTQLHEFEDLWTKVFSAQSVVLLTKINAEFNPVFVISTSWRLFMNRPAFHAVLASTKLGFVSENLHSDWQTPVISPTPQAWGSPIPVLRSDEIRAWLKQNPDCKHWAVLDDELSGSGLRGKHWGARAVLCKGDVGFGESEFEALRRVFNEWSTT
jgi:hypothetical protein